MIGTTNILSTSLGLHQRNFLQKLYHEGLYGLEVWKLGPDHGSELITLQGATLQAVKTREDPLRQRIASRIGNFLIERFGRGDVILA